MKNFSITKSRMLTFALNLAKYTLLCFFVCIFNYSCNDEEIQSLELNQNTNIQNKSSDDLHSLSKYPIILNDLELCMREKSSSRNAFFNLSDIDTSKVLVNHFDRGISTYSMTLVSDTTDNKIYNVIYETTNGVITNRKLVMHEYFSRKFLSVIKNTGGNVLDKFKWQGGNIGAELLDVGDPNIFWSNFTQLFPEIDGPLFLNPIHPLEQTWFLGAITFKFYPESNTTGSYTISMKIGNNLPFKIRF